MAFSVAMAIQARDMASRAFTSVFNSVNRLNGSLGMLQTRANTVARSGMASMMNTAKGFVVGSVLYGGVRKLTAGVGEMADEYGRFDLVTRKASAKWDEVQQGAIGYNEALMNTKKLSMQVGPLVGRSPAEMADVMDIFSAGGKDLNDISNDVMKTIGQLANVGDVDTKYAAEGMMTTLSTWGEEFTNLKSHANLIAQVANESTLSIYDIFESGKKAAPLFYAKKFKPKDLYESEMALAKFGIKGEMAGTALRGILQAYDRGQTRDVFQGLGINVGNKDGSYRKPVELIGALMEKLKNKSVVEKGPILKRMFEQEQIGAAMGIGNLSPNDVKEITSKLASYGDVLEEQNARIMDAMPMKAMQLKTAAMNKLFEVFETAAPSGRTFFEEMTAQLNGIDTTKFGVFLTEELPTLVTMLLDLSKTMQSEIIPTLAPVAKVLWELLKPVMAVLPSILEILVKFVLPLGAIIFAVMNIGVVWAAVWAIIDAVFLGILTVAGPVVAVILMIVSVVALIGVGFMKVKKHWWSITNAFQEGGIKAGIVAIGKTILDYLLTPIDLLLFAMNKIHVLSDENYQAYENFKRSLIDTPGFEVMKSGLPYGNLPQVTEEENGQKRFNPQYGIPESVKMPTVGQSAFVKVEFVNAPEGMKVIEKSGMVAPIGIGKLGVN